MTTLPATVAASVEEYGSQPSMSLEASTGSDQSPTVTTGASLTPGPAAQS